MQVLEFVAIQRKDTGAWAIPGGMVDPGEKVLFLMSNFDHHIQLFCRLIHMMKVSVTVKREFMEEALDSTGAAKVTICLSESVLTENLSLACLP